jgi:hypothetical protein
MNQVCFVTLKPLTLGIKKMDEVKTHHQMEADD